MPNRSRIKSAAAGGGPGRRARRRARGGEQARPRRRALTRARSPAPGLGSVRRVAGRGRRFLWAAGLGEREESARRASARRATQRAPLAGCRLHLPPCAPRPWQPHGAPRVASQPPIPRSRAPTPPPSAASGRTRACWARATQGVVWWAGERKKGGRVVRLSAPRLPRGAHPRPSPRQVGLARRPSPHRVPARGRRARALVRRAGAARGRRGGARGGRRRPRQQQGRRRRRRGRAGGPGRARGPARGTGAGGEPAASAWPAAAATASARPGTACSCSVAAIAPTVAGGGRVARRAARAHRRRGSVLGAARVTLRGGGGCARALGV